jgi:hypothetical protein
VSNSSQGSAGDPGASSFVAGNRPPATGAIPFTSGINPTANRASSGNHDDSGLAIRRAVKRNIRIGHDFHIPNPKVPERFTNSFAQLRTASTRQANLRCHNVFAPDLARFAGFIDRFAYCRGSPCDSHAQGIRWARSPLAQYSPVGVYNDGVRFAPASVDADHSIARPEPPGRQDIS